MLDTEIRDAEVYTNNKLEICNLGIKDGKIAQITTNENEAKEIVDAKGLTILPGVIDTQVHFREPGLTHKACIESESKAALRGGVTGFFEMPNTKPATTDQEKFEEKIKIASETSWTDFAFYVGATQKNVPELAKLENLPGCCGIKIFMGSSTGSLLLYAEEALDEILKTTKKMIALHCEDEDRLISRNHIATDGKHARFHPVWRDEEAALLATKKILRLAEKNQRKVHILHISTKQEIEFLKDKKDFCTFELTPQHLSMQAPDCYEKLGNFAQMNPPIRSKDHQDQLRLALKESWADLIGSDHAPHTREEKEKAYPASPAGLPGVQSIVPLMLDHLNQGNLSLKQLVDYLCLNPLKLYKIQNRGPIEVGASADLSIVDLKEEKVMQEDWFLYQCGWSPFAGEKVTGWPKGVFLSGQKAMWESEILGKQKGKMMEFA